VCVWIEDAAVFAANLVQSELALVGRMLFQAIFEFVFCFANLRQTYLCAISLYPYGD
jgi:hypothetical protein